MAFSRRAGIREWSRCISFAGLVCAGGAAVGCGSTNRGTVARGPLKGYPAPKAEVASTTTPPRHAATPATPAPRIASARPQPATTGAGTGEQGGGYWDPPRKHSASDGAMELDAARSNAVDQPRRETAAPPEPTGRLAVSGVAANDVLNMRSGPGPRHQIVGSIPPDADAVYPAGRTVRFGPSVWREVSYNGVRGWVNGRFLVEARTAGSR